MCGIMHVENYGQALKAVALSINTAMRRTESMPDDIKEKLLTRIKSLQNLHFKSTNHQML
jgi:hypothetical protein